MAVGSAVTVGRTGAVGDIDNKKVRFHYERHCTRRPSFRIFFLNTYVLEGSVKVMHVVVVPTRKS